MGDLTGRTAIVTGGGRATLDDGTRGLIGYGIATAFAKKRRKPGADRTQCSKADRCKG